MAWTERNGGHWVISRYDEVAEAFRAWEQFSSARTDPDVSTITISSGRIPLLIPEELDPPDWHPYRRVLAQLLSPGASEALRPRARHWIRAAIDDVIESGRCDVVSDLVVPIPASVTLEWLGFPPSDWRTFASVFHDMAAFSPGTAEYAKAAVAFGVVTRRVTEEVEERLRATPRRRPHLDRVPGDRR